MTEILYIQDFSRIINGGFYLDDVIKFICSEKASKFCEISSVKLSYVVPVKYTVEILQNFVAFSGYMNFI